MFEHSCLHLGQVELCNDLVREAGQLQVQRLLLFNLLSEVYWLQFR